MHLARCMNPLFAIALILVSGRVTLAQPVHSISARKHRNQHPMWLVGSNAPRDFHGILENDGCAETRGWRCGHLCGVLKAAQDNAGRTYRERSPSQDDHGEFSRPLFCRSQRPAA